MKTRQFIRTIFALAILLTFTIVSYAQPPDVLWWQWYGEDRYDYGCAVIQTTDGGYAIAGQLTPSGTTSGQPCLIKTNHDGIQTWAQSYEVGSQAFGLQQTADGGYILTGVALTPGNPNDDILLIRTDADGDTLWTRRLELGSDSHEVGYDIAVTADGGYFIAGYYATTSGAEPDGFLMKTDSNGNVLWSQTYGSTGEEYFWNCDLTSDGGCILVGEAPQPSGDENDVYLVKTDADGNEEWSMKYGGDDDDLGRDVKQTADGGYIVSGYWNHGYLTTDFYLIKTDASGNETWSYTYGGSQQDYARTVCQAPDGGYLLSGDSKSYGASWEDPVITVLRTDADGTELWVLPMLDSEYSYANDIIVDTEGYTVLVGNDYDTEHSSFDICLVCLDTGTGAVIEPSVQPLTFALHPAYPNPFNPSTTIAFDLPVTAEVTLDIFDINGCRVGVGLAPTRQYSAGRHTFTFDGSGLSSGLYFACLTAEDVVQTQKLMLLK